MWYLVSVSLNNRPKSPTLLLERYEINVHILDRISCRKYWNYVLGNGNASWLNEHWTIYLHLELFDRLPIQHDVTKTKNVVRQRTSSPYSCVTIRILFSVDITAPIFYLAYYSSIYITVLQDLVLDRLISWISQENLQNVGEKLAFLYVSIVSPLCFRSLDCFFLLCL
jgi:hypothetical protein